ncbi:MAG TPA: NmrA family transcriptional regulator [Chryseolinea sp.]|nr:NmrA family transcriptional regulator [Chryseolinea sp.]HPH47391.1 NmrA family transcriptional regulator [Chryseolinea sp.]HPM31195.1 NmrA family transcriptional regulator [Chryseolinea sp.]
METKKILVLGGKGKTGRRVASKLTDLGKVVRIGSRSEDPSFDWENEKTWDGALKGIDSVYITFQPDLAVPAALKTIEEFTLLAVRSGIKKMILLSGRGEKEAQACEQVVMGSGVNWTIVRASWFNQNFSESIFLEPLQVGHVALPQGETLEPFVDAGDIAEVVVESLLNDEHVGKIYELTGPRLLTFKHAVAEISNHIGRDIAFQSITILEYTTMLRNYQVPEDHIWLAEYLFTQVLDGRNSSITNDIEKVLGRKPKDFTEYVRETVVTGVWNSAN